MTAPDLVGMVRGLGAPFGVERSFKLVPGALLEDRYLISLHRSALGADAAGRLAEMARALGAADTVKDAVLEAFADADIVHVGYEDAGHHSIYKIYLEFASRVRRAQAQNAPDPVLVYLAYKWAADFPDRNALTRYTCTRYTWLPCRTGAAITERLRSLLVPGEAACALSCGLALVARAGRLTEARHLFLMMVEEPDNPRRSYDLNVYRADMKLADIADLVKDVASDLGVPQRLAGAVLERCGALDLGHLSGGRGRDGREFVTVYYGVEAHGR
jgi:hypothetical protein